MNRISYNEYRRQVFNHVILECFSRIQESCCGLEKCDDCHQDRLATIAKKMSDAFYTDKLNLNNSTIATTKKTLSEAVTFVQDCVEVADNIAATKADDAAKEELVLPSQQPIELNPEEEALIDKLFDEKKPEVQIDAVRDATVKALLEEDKKAQEIKNSLSIAQSQVANGTNPKALEEAARILGNRGPTSLMNAIMNAVSADAVRQVNEAAEKPVTVGKVVSENAEEIKDRAIMMYSLYEAASVFGVLKFTPSMVKKEAEKIFYNK